MPKLAKIFLFLWIAGIFWGTAALPSEAENSTVIPVEIHASANDPLGQDLLRQTTAFFKNDPTFLLTTDRPRLIIYLSTLAPSAAPTQAPSLTAYSLAVAFAVPDSSYPLLIGSTAGICTAGEIEADARAIWSNTVRITVAYADLTEKIRQPAEIK